MMSFASFSNRVVLVSLALAVLLLCGVARGKKQEEPPKIYDTRAVELFVEATIAEEVEDYYRAVVLYQEALHRDSTSVTIHMALAQLHQRLDQDESALMHLDAASNLTSNDTHILEWIVDLLGNQEKWLEQRPYVDHLLKLDSKNVTYNLQLANILYQTGDRKSARRVFRKVIDLASDKTETLERLGVMLILNEENKLAESCFLKLCELDPVNDKAQFTLGRIYLTLEKGRDAKQRMEMAIAINDTVAQYWTSLAVLDLDAERNAEAEHTLRRALDVLPDHPVLLDLLGSALERQKRYQEALDILYRSVSIDSTSVAPYITIGFVYDETNQFERAESTYVRALRIEPDNATLLNNYAYLLAARGLRLDEALRMSERSIEQTPDNPSYLDTMGWIYFKMEKPDHALEFLLKAAGLSDTENSELLDHIGDVYWTLQEYRKARDYWRRALKVSPDDESIKSKLQQPQSAQK